MPTASRQKYLERQASKKADALTLEDRQNEYNKVMNQLALITNAEVDQFEKYMAEWVNDGKVRQGVIQIPSIRRTICYSLGISHKKTFVVLRSDDYGKNTNTPKTKRTTFSKLDDIDEMPELVDTTHPVTTINTDSNHTTTLDSATLNSDTINSYTNNDNSNIVQLESDDINNIQNPSQNQNIINLVENIVTTSITNKDTVEKHKKHKTTTFTHPMPRGHRNASRPHIKIKPQSA